MKTLKKWVATLALALMIYTILPTMSANAQEAGVVESYMNCVNYCIDTYAPWSLRSMACSFDCYIAFYGNVIKAILGPVVSMV